MAELNDAGFSNGYDRISRAREGLQRNLKRTPTIAEIAKSTGIDETTVGNVVAQIGVEEYEKISRARAAIQDNPERAPTVAEIAEATRVDEATVGDVVDRIKLKGKVGPAREKLEKDLDRDPTDTEIAEEAGVDEASVGDVVDRMNLEAEIISAREELEKDLDRDPTNAEIAEEAGVDEASVGDVVDRIKLEGKITERQKTGKAAPSEQTVRISHKSPVAGGSRTGICLSGGGIRAASFAMGALQAFQAPNKSGDGSDFLGESHILTAVSGGGYFGGAYEMDRSHGIFELNPLATPRPFAPGTVEEIHVRQRSSFLARTAREKFRLFGHLLVGVAINVVFLAGLLYVLLRPAGWFLGNLLSDGFDDIGKDLEGDGWFGLRFAHLRDLLPLALWIAIGVIAIIAAGLATGALIGWIADRASGGVDKEGKVRSLRETLRNWSDSAAVMALLAFALLIVIPFAIWLFYDLIPGLLGNGPTVTDFFASGGAGGDFLALFAAGGSLAFLAAAAKSQLEALKPTWWVRIAVFVVVPVMVLWIVAVFVRGAVLNQVTGATWPFGMSEIARWGVVLFLLCVFWLLADQRSWSLYPVYRESLEKAFAVERVWIPRGDAEHLQVELSRELYIALEEEGVEKTRADGLIEYIGTRWLAELVVETRSRPDLIPELVSDRLKATLSGYGFVDRNEVRGLRVGLSRALEGIPSETGGPGNSAAWSISPKVCVNADGKKPFRYIDFAKTFTTQETGDGEGVIDAEALPIGPRFISCAAANVRDAEQTAPDLQAASFHFSHETIGSPHEAIGEVPTGQYQRALDGTVRRQDVTVPAAMAMSGAAISPAMGKHSKSWLAAFMALANARLGVWLPSPRWIAEVAPDLDSGETGGENNGTPLWYEKPRVSYLLKEILGIHAIDDRFLYITDGGHYDNLGLVELLRQGCNTVVVVDASGDEPGVFTTFGQAMALARAELGVWFDIDLDKLRGDDKSVAEDYEAKQLKLPWRGRTAEERGGVLMKNAYVWGKYHYRREVGKPPVEGDICYIQTAVTRETPWQVRAYWEADPRFPNHSTLDQSFTFEEFEAYRALGYWAGATARYGRERPPAASTESRTFARPWMTESR